jgi:hypothetical protein
MALTRGFLWSSRSQKSGWRRARKRKRLYKRRGKLVWRRGSRRPANEKRGMAMEAVAVSEVTGIRRSEVVEGVAVDVGAGVETFESGINEIYAGLYRVRKSWNVTLHELLVERSSLIYVDMGNQQYIST